MSQSPPQPPKPHIIPPLAAHTHTIILLHGRGGSGPSFANDLFALTSQVARPSAPPPPSQNINLTLPVPDPLPARFPTCKWIFPSTRLRFSSTFGQPWAEWFDTISLSDPSERQDLQIRGLKESVSDILAIIEEEAALVKPSNIILGGFSQGCATASHVLMALDVRLGGFVGISGWMPFARQIKEKGKEAGRGGHEDGAAPAHGGGDGGRGRAAEYVRANLGIGDASVGVVRRRGGPGRWEETPIFLGHGLYDNIVRCELGKEAKETLASAGANVFWHTYDSEEHWLKEPEEVEDMVDFIYQCLT